MKNCFAFMCLLLSTMAIVAQNDTIIDCCREMTDPEFPGGHVGLLDFIRENLQYPAEALQNKKQGTVFIQFVVEPDSTLTNIHVVRGLGYGCDEEALRIVEKMPKWTPGSMNGKVCRVQHNVPVLFVLPYDTNIVTETLIPDVHYDYYEIIEVAPEFPGGTVALMKFIRKNTRYPKEAKKNNIKGTVYASFVINETGKVSNAKILKGLGYGCDEEALRIIGLMPNWIPAQTKGKPVQVEFNLPIRFGK
ncbi:hypothetical protein DSECCO2_554550 [anaerobic digester metagenome]